jgi:hypothetical protein
MRFIVSVSERRMQQEGITVNDISKGICDLLDATLGGPISVTFARQYQPKRKTKLKKGTRK